MGHLGPRFFILRALDQFLWLLELLLLSLDLLLEDYGVECITDALNEQLTVSVRDESFLRLDGLLIEALRLLLRLERCLFFASRLQEQVRLHRRQEAW